MFLASLSTIYDAVTSYLFEDPLMIFLIGLGLLILFFWYFATEIEKYKRNLGTALIIGLTALCLAATVPPTEKLKGGIDIVGGASFSLQVQPQEGPNGKQRPITTSQVEQAMAVIEKRLLEIGYREAIMFQQGQDGIMLQIPGVEPEAAEDIRQTLMKVAKLTIHRVSERSNEPVQNGTKTLAQAVLDGEEFVVGQRAYTYEYTDEDGNKLEQAVLLYRRAALDGEDIADAQPSPQQSDAVAITLDGDGAEKMLALTSDMNIGQDRMAVVLDGEVVNVATVQAQLYKNFVIEGLDDRAEVERLSKQLLNPLQNPLVPGEMRIISPTLGEAVVSQGLMAGGLALALTYLFMLVYYRFSGIVAAISLTLCGVLLFGFMAMFGFTFSLPGIAGMILIVGMAVDANVLIYERMREEFDAGKDARNAINAAYDKAFSAIFDSNITTLITAFILYMLGSGAIKSFATTLIIGICASMFAAILGTRTFYRWALDAKLIRKLSFMNLIRSTNFDFMGKRKAYAVVGIGLILISVAGMVAKKDRMLGIDFTGGTTLTYQLGQDTGEIPIDEIDAALGELTLTRQAYAQKESNPASGLQLIVRCDTSDAKEINEKLRSTFDVLGQTTLKFPLGEEVEIETSEVDSTLAGLELQQQAEARIGSIELEEKKETKALLVSCDFKDAERIRDALTESFETLNEKQVRTAHAVDASTEEVSAVIGGRFLTQALIAVACGLVAITLYMTARFEFSFALGGFVAMLHDIVIAIGIVVILGSELSLIHVGAVLTIAGYSINDTIIVFDRIRETLLIRSGSILKIMNEAINQTLSRTLITSGTTIFTVAILTIFGGAALRDFGLVILVGIVIGTFSSIFVASPIVLWWSKKRGRSIREEVLETTARAESMASQP